MDLDQGWATIFVRGAHLSFICISLAKIMYDEIGYEL